MTPEQLVELFAIVGADYRIEMSMDMVLDGFAIWLADARRRLQMNDEDFNTLCAVGGMLYRHGLRSRADDPDAMERNLADLLKRYGRPLDET